MPVSTTCPHCGQALKGCFSPGQLVTCSNKHAFIVPEQDGEGKPAPFYLPKDAEPSLEVRST